MDGMVREGCLVTFGGWMGLSFFPALIIAWSRRSEVFELRVADS